MDKLKECVLALKDVRRSMQNDVDPCILAALDEAIAKLERCETEGVDQPSMAQAVTAALGVISDVITCVTGVAELMKILGA
jgi:hypothetical protein